MWCHLAPVRRSRLLSKWGKDLEAALREVMKCRESDCGQFSRPAWKLRLESKETSPYDYFNRGQELMTWLSEAGEVTMDTLLYALVFIGL